MTITATQIITQAYRDIGGLRPGQTASADTLSESLDHLNQMIEEWAVDRLQVGLVGGTSLASFANLATLYNLAPGFAEALRKNLAVKIAPMMKVYWKIEAPLLEEVAGDAALSRAAVEGAGWV